MRSRHWNHFSYDPVQPVGVHCRKKLQALNCLRQQYNRFEVQKPRRLNAQEIEAVRRVASDLPSLWQGDVLPIKTKKQIVRELIHSVTATVVDNTELVQVGITWVGGYKTETQIIRPVARLNQLSAYSQIVSRVRTLTAEGVTATEFGLFMVPKGPDQGASCYCWGHAAAGRLGG